MSTRLRVGILGSSFGATVHAPAFNAHERFQVVAIASPNNAHEAAAKLKIPAAFSSLEAMLEQSDLDVLSIATPPFDHYRAVLTGLGRKLHILCEKPFTQNLEQAEELLAASRRAGTACAIAHEFRFLPTRRAIKELIVNGHLGALRSFEVSGTGSFLRADADKKRSWWFDVAKGGGITGAWLSHFVDSANWLAGRPPVTSVGVMRTANPQRRDAAGTFASTVDDGAFAILDYGDGLVARVSADGTLQVEAMVIAAHGEQRTVVASGEKIHDARIFTVDAEETSELQLRALPHASLAAIDPLLPAFRSMLDGFVELIDGKPSEIATFADGVETQRVLDAVGYGRPRA